MDLDALVDFSEAIEKKLENNPLLSFQFLPGPNGTRPGPQEQFFNSQAKIRVLMGGNRSGKSEMGAYTVLQKALSTPGGRGWCACPSNEMSVMVQQRKVWKLLPKDQVKYAHYDSVNGFRHGIIEFKNGFVLVFKSYEQGVEKFQSDDIDILWADEEPPYTLYQEGLMRTLDRGGDTIITLTPLNGHTKFVEEVLLKKRTGAGQVIQVFTINTEDNIHLSSDQLLMLLDEIDEDMKPARLHGIPVNIQGLVYPDWRDQYPHVVTVDQWEKIKHQTTRYTAIDPHNRTPTAVGFYGVDRDGRYWLYDEIFERLMIDELATAIKEKERGIEPDWRVIDNSAQAGDLTEGRSLRMQLMEKGVETMLAKKDNKNTGSIALMRKLLRVPEDGSLPMFVVVENCTRARFEFSRYSWASYGSSKAENEKEPKAEVKKKDDHIMDCNHYIVRSGAGYMGDDRDAGVEIPQSNGPMGAYEYAQLNKKNHEYHGVNSYRAA